MTMSPEMRVLPLIPASVTCQGGYVGTWDVLQYMLHLIYFLFADWSTQEWQSEHYLFIRE